MAKIKSIAFAVGIMLLIGAALSHEARQKQTYWTIAGVSLAYLLVWVIANVLIICKKRKGM